MTTSPSDPTDEPYVRVDLPDGPVDLPPGFLSCVELVTCPDCGFVWEFLECYRAVISGDHDQAKAILRHWFDDPVNRERDSQ